MNNFYTLRDRIKLLIFASNSVFLLTVCFVSFLSFTKMKSKNSNYIESLEQDSILEIGDFVQIKNIKDDKLWSSTLNNE